MISEVFFPPAAYRASSVPGVRGSKSGYEAKSDEILKLGRSFTGRRWR